MNNILSFIGVLSVTALTVNAVDHNDCNAPPEMATTNMPFTGVASGGELVLADTLNRNARYVSIHTYPGESAESVASRMAASIKNSGMDGFGHFTDVGSKGGNLTGLVGFHEAGEFLLAGTEIGLGIPQAPTSLSSFYDTITDKIALRWINPSHTYDKIAIVFNWDNYDHKAIVTVPGTANEYTVDLTKKKSINVDDLDVWIIGYRDQIPSNAAAIHIESNSQEELFGIPFTEGVAPNWKRWKTGENEKRVICKQGINSDRIFRQRRFNPIKRPCEKPYFQIIETNSLSETGGVYRKFLGLKSGHTYRLYTRMNTFEMDRVQDNWSFSFHAAPHGKAVTLSSEQMAGISSLPDGSAGPQTGQVIAYGPASTTKGKFVEASTGNSSMLDITMPEGAEVITVWFRYSGAPCSGVGFDWIKLKDVTPK